MSHEKLKALIEQAWREDKIIYCPGNNNYYAVEEIEEYRQGKLLCAVEQDIETVDIKISESKVPAIGNELAKFWEELLIDTYNNKNLQQNESDARNGN